MTDRIDLGLKDTAGGCSGCDPSTSAAAATLAAAAPAVTEEGLVARMTCAHCVASVTAELTGIAGVQNVVVDLHPDGASRVAIHSATPIGASAVKAAVEEAGYVQASS